ncbi:MAG: AAA family ATPase [Clostridium sp.]|nr:AAA family ATPase [Clostridium sp.]MDU6347928.1 AAA family ATPase [Clostridium sp.]
MDSRISIRTITIKNFRSIRRENIKVGDFNIFVGMNDAGKSNVLKAMNLFFNDRVEENVPYSYKRDFSYLYPPKSKEAKAITITIQFYIPSTFSDGGLYTWEKVWKQTGKVSDVIKNAKGEEPGSRSRIPAALQKIKYRYVPAIKSDAYFKSLLADLYSSVSASLDTTLAEAVQLFSDTLSGYTQSITLDASKRLNISSQLEIPENLGEIFRSLVFRTNKSIDSISVPLTSRGDGIQARHIPIILKYIANEDQKSRNQGSTKVTTIWGIEEPENGLELSNAFALADEFVEYAKELQIFITTHSPAFYMKKEENGVTVFYVEKKESRSEETQINTGKTNKAIASEMGLMPLIAPYVEEQKKKYEERLQLLKSAVQLYDTESLSDIPTIFVEGKTDIEYLTMAIKIHSVELQKLLDNKKLRIFSKEGRGGCGMIEHLVYAWIYLGNKSRCIALFDKDDAGCTVKNRMEASSIFKGSENVSSKFISPMQEIIALLSRKGCDFPFEIEHILSIDCWKKITEKKLAVRRETDELYKMVKSSLGTTQTIDDALESLSTNADFVNTIVKMQPHKDKKTQICEFVKKQVDNGKFDFLSGFENTISAIEKILIK